MAVETLVAGAIAILTPYLVAGATKAAETIGEDMANKAKGLLEKIRGWLGRDDRSAGALKQYEADPALYGDAAEKVLAAQLQREPELVGQLQTMLDGFGSRIVVRQKIGELAGAATGLDVRTVMRGLDAYVEQDVDRVEAGATLTGAKIEET